MLLKIAPFWIICLGIIGLLILVLHLIIRISGARRRTIGLAQLHNDQRGGVQSLSFVLTLPVFIWIMMGVIQVSQIMLAQVVVEYAAISAARAASAWTGEYVSSEDGTTEDRNCVGKAAFVFKSQIEGGSLYTIPVSNSGPTSDSGDTGDSGAEDTVKISVIRRAAVLACIPIAPSRDTGYTLPSKYMGVHTALDNAFSALAGEKSAAPPEAVSRRLRNKLAYSMANTFFEAEFFHPSDEIALQKYDKHYQANPTYLSGQVLIPTKPGCSDPDCAPDGVYSHPDYQGEALSFEPNEMGWQDVITVHVRHNMALLPGPGRLLSRFVHGTSDGNDKIAQTIETNTQSKETLYTWPLFASASASIEGEKPILRYTQPVTLLSN